MEKKHKEQPPGVRLDKAKIKPLGNHSLKELAKELAARKYNPKDNTAFKRLEERFKKL